MKQRYSRLENQFWSTSGLNGAASPLTFLVRGSSVTKKSGPCKQIAPIVAQLADEYAGSAKIGKVNAADEMELAQQYDVMGVPALLFFKDGELVDRRAGFGPQTTKGALSGVLDKLLQDADSDSGQTLDWF